jgi:hypothetical protein
LAASFFKYKVSKAVHQLSRHHIMSQTHTPRRLSMMVLLSLGLVGFNAWAAFFDHDQSARTQVIQSVDGGPLSER